MTGGQSLHFRHLARIVESSDDAIVSKDLEGIVQSWNAAAERIFGYAASEMMGRSIRTIIPPDLQAQEDEILARIRAGRNVDHIETVRCRKDGTLVHVSVTVSPVFDDHGRVIGASKIARDISERVRMTAAAIEQARTTEKLSEIGAQVASSLEADDITRQVIESGTDLTEAEFGAFFFNDRTVGSRERAVLRGHSGGERNPLQYLSSIRATAIFGPVFDGTLLVVDDFAAETKDETWASLLAVPIKRPGGAAIGALVFCHSRRGAFTHQHRQLAIGIASWGYLALENARLFLQARNADRLKDDFLAVLSHELRTPLSAILGYARLLRGDLLPAEKVKDGLMALERNATALNQIVDDVLDVSRIVAGKLRLNVQPVELSLVIQDAMSTVQPAATAKGVRVQTVIDPTIGPVSGDPGRLTQVVWNLLSNAVKFTPRDGRVQVRLERVNSHVEIIVSDTGSGIRADFLPNVFDQFRQADSGVTRASGGLGLGLSIVRSLVEMHGGRVRVASPGEGQGSTFRVELPLMIMHPEAVEQPRLHPLTASAEPNNNLVDLRGVRVLAIDDEQDARSLLQVVLESAGAEVFTFSSAVTALERIAELRPDVLVVDIGMPEMDGLTFISRLRASKNPDTEDVPAAALTAFARPEDRTKALESGFEMHLAKPVDPRELAASVATLVRRGRRGRTVR